MNNFFLFIIIYLVISFSWKGLEILINGEITPRIVDDVIGIILTVFVLKSINVNKRKEG